MKHSKRDERRVTHHVVLDLGEIKAALIEYAMRHLDLKTEELSTSEQPYFQGRQKVEDLSVHGEICGALLPGSEVQLVFSTLSVETQAS